MMIKIQGTRIALEIYYCLFENFNKAIIIFRSNPNVGKCWGMGPTGKYKHSNRAINPPTKSFSFYLILNWLVPSKIR